MKINTVSQTPYYLLYSSDNKPFLMGLTNLYEPNKNYMDTSNIIKPDNFDSEDYKYQFSDLDWIQSNKRERWKKRKKSQKHKRGRKKCKICKIKRRRGRGRKGRQRRSKRRRRRKKYLNLHIVHRPTAL